MFPEAWSEKSPRCLAGRLRSFIQCPNAQLHMLHLIMILKINVNSALATCRYKDRMPTHNGVQFSSNNPNVLYPGSYSDTGYLQMLGAYLTPSTSGYKSVDPYFLSQGNTSLHRFFFLNFSSSTPIIYYRIINYLNQLFRVFWKSLLW